MVNNVDVDDFINGTVGEEKLEILIESGGVSTIVVFVICIMLDSLMHSCYQSIKNIQEHFFVAHQNTMDS